MDASQDAASSETLDALEWAAVVELGRRLSLGEIEAEIMRRRIPPKPPLTVGNRIGQVIGFAIAVPLGLAVLTAPFVATGIVLAHAAAIDPLVTSDLLGLGRFAMVVSAILPMAILAIWWNARDRHRRWWDLPAIALVTLLAATSLATVVVTGLDAFGAGIVLWTGAALVTGVGTFIGILVASRPGAVPARARRNPEEERFGQVRAQAYDVLVRRGLADDRDSTAEVLDMPRGGWIERDRQRGRG